MTPVSIGQLSKAFADQNQLSIRDVPESILANMGDSGKAAWTLSKGPDTYITQATEKADADGVHRGCVITARATGLTNLKSEMEVRYRIKKVDESLQGFSKVTVYVADLIGYPKSMGIAVQEMGDGLPETAAIALSLFEIRN